MKNLDYKLFLDNIQYLCRIKNIKLGELEKEIGSSVGYFARLKKEDGSYSAPSIDKIFLISEKFNISIDYLLTTPLAAFTSTELYVISNLKKMTALTNSDKVYWQLFTKEDFYLEPEFENGKVVNQHILAKCIENSFNNDYYEFRYYSKFLKCEFDLADNIYSTLIENKGFIISKVKKSGSDAYGFELYCYTLDDKNDKILSPVCYSFSDGKYFVLLKTLYDDCVASSKRPSLDKNVIDAFSCIDNLLND